MADYGRQSHDLTSPQVQDYEQPSSMSIGNNGSHSSENDGGSPTNGAGAGAGAGNGNGNGAGVEHRAMSPISTGPDMPQQVHDVLASEVQFPNIRRYRRITWLIRTDRCFHHAEQT